MGSLNMWDIKKSGEWGRTQYSLGKHLSGMDLGLIHSWIGDETFCSVLQRKSGNGLNLEVSAILLTYYSMIVIVNDPFTAKRGMWYKKRVVMNLIPVSESQLSSGLPRNFCEHVSTGLSASAVVVSLLLVPEMVGVSSLWVYFLTLQSTRLAHPLFSGCVLGNFP